MDAVMLRNGNPAAILSACRAAARRAGWTLARWDEFSASCRACLSPDAEPAEVEAFMAVVRSHFYVTLAPTCRWAPADWKPELMETDE